MPAQTRRLEATALSTVLALFLTAPAAPAAIQNLVALKEVLESQQLIFLADVDRLDPSKPSVILTTSAIDALKGQPPFERLPVNLSGDSEAKKGDHTKVMLERLAPGRKVIVFASKKGARYNAMAFTEGTWFSLQGTIDEDGKTVRWAFLHGEPYLRRTFVGTTAELKKVVEDGLAKKAEPPKPNEKEKPGFGPPVEKPEKKSQERCPASKSSLLAIHPSPLPLFGVIPSLALAGPLAILAALFPGLFARLAVGMKRWRAFLVVASINTTLAAVYFALREYNLLPDWRVSRPEVFSVGLLGVTFIGLVWAGRRYRRMGVEEAAVTSHPKPRELVILCGITVGTALIPVATRLFGYPWESALELPMREFTFIAIGLAASTVYVAYRMATSHIDRLPDGSAPGVRLSLSGESVGLATLFLCGLLSIALSWNGNLQRSSIAANTTAGEANDVVGPRLAGVRVFEIPDATKVMSRLTVTTDRLYLGALQQNGFSQSGLVYCLDRETGALQWKFEPDDLKPVFSGPAVSEGKVYVGEGLHEHGECRLFCLDAVTGKPAWATPFATTSHTEGTPRVANGKVYFSAGDDGLFCADAATGARRWQAEGKPRQRHIDGPPAVAGNRVFVGSGLYAPALYCFDADNGNELWRTPAPYRSFGAPVVFGDRVAFGLGTGNLTTDTVDYSHDGCPVKEAEPAGAVVCLAAAVGREVWRYDLSRSVHTPLAADAFSVYATARDGGVHCLDRETGKLRWKTGIGGAVLAGAAVAAIDGFPIAVYAVSREGRVVCLNPQTGKVVWQKELPGYSWDGQDGNGVLSTPAVVTTSTQAGSRRALYIGAMLTSQNTTKKTAAVFRFDDEIGE